MNKVILVGHLATEPEIRQTPNGINVARFVVAVQRRYQKDGERQADFITCVAWRKTAEFVYQYFKKGSGIALCGNLQIRSWTGNDGQKRYAAEVVVEEVNFNGGRKENNSSGNSGGYSQSGKFSADPIHGQSAMMDTADMRENEFADIDFDEGDLPF